MDNNLDSIYAIVVTHNDDRKTLAGLKNKDGVSQPLIAHTEDGLADLFVHVTLISQVTKVKSAIISRFKYDADAMLEASRAFEKLRNSDE